MLKLFVFVGMGCAWNTVQQCLMEGACVVQASPLGVTAKVADFGLSRDMLCASKIETRTCGTITHMPPELLSSDVMSKVGPPSFCTCLGRPAAQDGYVFHNVLGLCMHLSTAVTERDAETARGLPHSVTGCGPHLKSYG